MIKRHCFVVLTTLFFFSVKIQAQEGFSKWEKGYYEEVASQEQIDFVKKVVLPVGVILPKSSLEENNGEEIDWNIYFKKGFASLFSQTKHYDYSKPVAVAYGIFCLGNFDTWMYRKNIKNNMNDTVWMEDTYKKIKPILKQGWLLLDEKTRSIYIDVIKGIDVYLKSFNYDAENNYLKHLKQNELEDRFTWYSLNQSKDNDFRKTEAFIFRRIDDARKGNGTWSVHWTKRMVKDLIKFLGIK